MTRRRITTEWRAEASQTTYTAARCPNAQHATEGASGDVTNSMSPYQQKHRLRWRKKRESRRRDFMKALREHSRWLEEMDAHRPQDPSCAICEIPIGGVICMGGDSKPLHWGCRESLANDVWHWNTVTTWKCSITSDASRETVCTTDVPKQGSSMPHATKRTAPKLCRFRQIPRQTHRVRNEFAGEQCYPDRHTTVCTWGDETRNTGTTARISGRPSRNTRTFLLPVATDEMRFHMESICLPEGKHTPIRYCGEAFRDCSKHMPRVYPTDARNDLALREVGSTLSGKHNKCAHRFILACARGRIERQRWQRALQGGLQNDEATCRRGNIDQVSNCKFLQRFLEQRGLYMEVIEVGQVQDFHKNHVLISRMFGDSGGRKIGVAVACLTSQHLWRVCREDMRSVQRVQNVVSFKGKPFKNSIGGRADVVQGQPRPVQCGRSPADKKAEPAPLVNGDNRCYLNSVLQCLWHCTSFETAAQDLIGQGATEEDSTLLPGIHWQLLRDYQNIYNRSMDERERNSASHIATRIHEGEQMDAQEFLANCLNDIECDGSPLASLWSGKEQKRYRCNSDRCGAWLYELECPEGSDGRCSANMSTDFRLLQLHVMHNNEPIQHLAQSIELYESEERMIDGDTRFRCAQCGNNRLPYHRTSITRAPQILMIHLRCFAYDAQKRRIEKVAHQMHIPQQVYVAGDVYDLRCTVVHGGPEAGSGHYWAFVNRDKEWHLCNDAKIEKVSQPEPWNRDLGYDKQVVYLLFYEKTSGEVLRLSEAAGYGTQEGTGYEAGRSSMDNSDYDERAGCCGEEETVESSVIRSESVMDAMGRDGVLMNTKQPVKSIFHKPEADPTAWGSRRSEESTGKPCKLRQTSDVSTKQYGHGQPNAASTNENTQTKGLRAGTQSEARLHSHQCNSEKPTDLDGDIDHRPNEKLGEPQATEQKTRARPASASDMHQSMLQRFPCQAIKKRSRHERVHLDPPDVAVLYNMYLAAANWNWKENMGRDPGNKPQANAGGTGILPADLERFLYAHCPQGEWQLRRILSASWISSWQQRQAQQNDEATLVRERCLNAQNLCLELLSEYKVTMKTNEERISELGQEGWEALEVGGISGNESLSDVLALALLGGCSIANDKDMVDSRQKMCARARARINKDPEADIGTRLKERRGAWAIASDEEHYQAPYERVKHVHPLMKYWFRKFEKSTERLQGGVRVRIYTRMDCVECDPEAHEMSLAGTEESEMPPLAHCTVRTSERRFAGVLVPVVDRSDAETENYEGQTAKNIALGDDNTLSRLSGSSYGKVSQRRAA